jgi:hypothetical protein
MSEKDLADAVRTLKAELDGEEDVFNLYDPDAAEAETGAEPWAQLVLVKGRHIRIRVEEV